MKLEFIKTYISSKDKKIKIKSIACGFLRKQQRFHLRKQMYQQKYREKYRISVSP